MNKPAITYKGQPLYYDEDPRTGVCNMCRAVMPFDCALTQMHHGVYHDDDPLRDTIETCPRCYRIIEHWRAPYEKHRATKNVKVSARAHSKLLELKKHYGIVGGDVMVRILDE